MTESAQGILCCWQCGKEITVLRTQVNANVECPYCKAEVTVPSQLFGVPPAARTVRTASAARKSPATAGLLNFLFWGAGYIYAGRGWGWAILIPDILLNLVGLGMMANVSAGDVALGTLITLPIAIALGWHAYHMVKEAQSVIS
jgi:hypothetical protein